MRMSILVTSVAATALLVATLMPVQAGALPIANADSAHAAFDDVGPIEKSACWGYGWRGWGWYPVCVPPPVPVVPAPAVAAPAWAYAPGCRDVTIRERRGDETVVRHVHRCD
jgi:hypothetical protein